MPDISMTAYVRAEVTEKTLNVKVYHEPGTGRKMVNVYSDTISLYLTEPDARTLFTEGLAVLDQQAAAA